MRSNKMNETSRTQLANEAVQAYIEVTDAIRIAILPGWITSDLTISQAKALIMLGHHGALAVSELARLLDIGNPAASVLVQQLVEQALVERSEDTKDRRRTLVHLTEEGSKLMSGRQEQRVAKFRGWLGKLRDEDLVSLLNGLDALVEIMRSEQTQINQMAEPEYDLGKKG